MAGAAGRPGGGEGTAGPRGGSHPERDPAHPTRRPPGSRVRALVRGRFATSLRPGAAPCTSAASVTFPAVDPGYVVDRVRPPVPSINRRTRIHHGNRRTLRL